MATDEDERVREAACLHEWEIGVDGWGVVLGVSRCKRCGKVARKADFPSLAAATRPAKGGD
jgi:hypothetical protein